MRPVEQLRVGDQLWGYDVVSRQRIRTTLRSIVPSVADQLVSIGNGLRTTARHPIYADGSWVAAGRLAVGARLLRTDGQPAVLQSLGLREGVSQVFDLTVDWPHTFFAGGYLVHNKAAPSPASRQAGGRLWHTVRSRPSTMK